MNNFRVLRRLKILKIIYEYVPIIIIEGNVKSFFLIVIIRDKDIF